MDLPANCDRFVFSMGEKEFLVSSFTAREYLSRPFEIFVGIAHEDDFDADGFFGAPASLFIDSDESPRWFHGFVCAIERGAVKKGRFYTSRVKVVSRLHITTQIADCRVFMDMSTPEVVSSVLRGDGFTAKEFAFAMNPAPYPKKEHRTQYRETDFAFFSRLLEHEGIYYLFEHTDKDHRLVLADSPAAYRPIPEPVISYNPAPGLAPDKEVASSFILGYQLVTGNIVLSDYNFKKPLLDLSAGHSADNFPELRRVDWPGNFDSAEEARRMAKVRLEQHQRDAVYAGGKSNCPRLIPGGTFTLADHYEDEFNAEYLITSVIHTGRQPGVFAEQSAGGTGFYYTNRFKAVPAQVPWRPSLNFPVPHIRGVQHAVVVGPANEEIHVDEYARVKVQFKWDRKGLMDEHSSCWMRVGEMEAGEGFGTTFIPRVGQEVLVEYLNGHPDKPLITSRVYNGDNLPPWALPDDKTQSGFKTDTSPGGGGCNQIRFDDRKNHEQLFIQAEKDHTVKVKNDTKTYVGGDSHLSVGRDELIATERDKHTRVGADSITRIGGNDHLTVEGDHAVKIDGNLDRVTAGPIAKEIGGDYHKNVEGHYDVKALSLFAEADNEIAITVGGSFISIKPGCIDIHGPVVSLGGGRPDELQPLPFISPIAPQAPQGVAPLPAGRPPRKAPAPEAAKPPETKPLRIVPPKKSDEQPHKLAVEVAGATGAAVPGALLAHGDNGIRQSAAFNGLDGGYRRQVFIKDILPGSYHLTYDLDGLKIPLDLGTPVDSVPESAFSDRWETIVVPVVPRAYCHHRMLRLENFADYPRTNGYIYVYINGYLWRELETGEKGVLNDIDLEQYKGRDRRPATGTQVRHILVPFQVNGKQPKIEICFSEIQWSWSQVQLLGGMDPNDIRHGKGPKVQPCENPSKAAALRKKRMQPLKLDSYPDFKTKRRGKGVVTVGSTEQKRKGKPIRPDLAAHQGERLPVVYLHDALGIAQRLVSRYDHKLAELRACVAGLYELRNVPDLDPAVAGLDAEQKRAYYGAANLAYRLFYDQRTTDDDGDVPRIIKNCRDKTDQDLIETILQVKQRRKLRGNLTNAKKLLAYWLNDKQFIGGSVKEKHPDFISVQAMLNDYANSGVDAYASLWSRASTLFRFLGHSPLDEDYGLDCDCPSPERLKKLHDKDPGVVYLKALVKSGHPLHKALFPTKQQVDIFSQDALAYHEPEPPDGSGAFRPAAFQQALTDNKQQVPASKTVSAAAKTAKQFAADFLFCFVELARHQSGLNETNCLFRLIKAINDPALDGLHLRAAEDLDEMAKQGFLPPGSGKPHFDSISAAAAPDRTGAPSPKGLTWKDWKTLWRSPKKAILAVRNTSAYARGVKAAQGIRQTAPPIIAIVEMFNFCKVTGRFAQQFKEKSFSYKNTAVFLISCAGLSYYTLDAVKAIVGDDIKLTKALNFRNFSIGDKLFVNRIKFAGGNITRYQGWSAGISGLSGLVYFYEMTNRMQANDYDAAAAYGLAGASYIGLSCLK